MARLEDLYKTAENLTLKTVELNKEFSTLNNKLKQVLEEIKAEEEKSTIPYQVGRLYGRKAANGN